MKRKSGLADSPFFSPPVHELEQPAVAIPQSIEPVSPPMEAQQTASLQASNIASKQTSLLAQMKEVGHLKATHAATFRFPPELLERLTEAEYRLRKDHKIKTTKNTIIVGALAWLLCEFESKKAESYLHKYLISK